MKYSKTLDWQSVQLMLMWRAPKTVKHTDVYTTLWGLIQTINTTNEELQTQLQSATPQQSPILKQTLADKQRLYPLDDFPLIAFHPTQQSYQNTILAPDSPFMLTLSFGGEHAHLAEQWLTWFQHRLTLENTGFEYLCAIWEQHQATLPTLAHNCPQPETEINLFFDLPTQFDYKIKHEHHSAIEQFQHHFVRHIQKRLIQWFPSQSAMIKTWFEQHQTALQSAPIHIYQLHQQHHIKTQSKSSKNLNPKDNVQFHHGFVGWLTLKGAWTQLNALWKILLNIHFLGQRTKINGLGYALPEAQAPHSPPLLWQKWTQPNYIQQIVADVLTDYDLDPMFDETGQIMQHQAISQHIHHLLSQNLYTPQPTLATFIPTSSGNTRRIEQLHQQDFIVHRLIAYHLTPILDQYLSPYSLGYRKGYSRDKIQQKIQKLIHQGFNWVLECDVEDFFNQISITSLCEHLRGLFPKREHQSIDFIQKLMQIGYGFPHETEIHQREKGLIQGSPLSPVLANIYLAQLDTVLHDEQICFVRYADDILIFCREHEDSQDILLTIKQSLSHLGLSLNVSKNKITSISQGFEFLGLYFDKEGNQDQSAFPKLTQKKPLIITGDYKYLKLNGSAIEVRQTLAHHPPSSQLLNIVPLRRIDQLMIFGQHHISTPLLSACAKHHISVHIVNQYGFQLATFAPNNADYFAISAKQYIEHHALKPHEKLSIACDLLNAKIHNYQTWIKHSYREGDHILIEQLDTIKNRLISSSDRAQLMGYEGQASKLCFQRLQQLIIPEQKKAFSSKRRQRGGKDRLNSVLNFGYYWLFTRMSSLIRCHGLNPYLSFLHEAEQDYETLVYDLMEPFRVFVDKTVIRLINRKQIQARDFYLHEQKGWQLRNQAIRLYSAELEATLNQTIDGCLLDDIILVQVRTVQQWAINRVSLKWFYWQQGEK